MTDSLVDCKQSPLSLSAHLYWGISYFTHSLFLIAIDRSIR